MGTRHRGPAREVRALDAYIKLKRAVRSVDACTLPALRAEKLTENQFAVLELLWHLGPCAQHEIGEKILTSRANVTLIVDQLGRRGLVRRERDAADRRCMRVELTEAGRRLIARIFPEHAARLADAFSALTAAEQRELARLCRKLGRAAAARQPPSSSSSARRGMR
ncbi:MAG: MarR family transcriptional regulator [Acidobacteriota bacterium]